MGWYAIHVRTGNEDTVCEAIRKQVARIGYAGEFELLVPKRKLYERRQGVFSEVVHTLFPGYVLVQSTDIWKLAKLTRPCKGVFRYLESEGEFQEVNPAEICFVLRLTNSESEIEPSEVIMEDGITKVLNGPLKGNEGLIKKIDWHKQRAKVGFWFRGREYVVGLGIRMMDFSPDAIIKLGPFKKHNL